MVNVTDDYNVFVMMTLAASAEDVVKQLISW